MRLLKITIVLSGILFMGLLAKELWPQVLEQGLDISWASLTLSLALLVLVFLLDAYGWLLLLSSLGHRLDVLPQIRIWLLSSVARYIPGGIWSYVSRAEMTHGHGVDMVSIGAALYLETVMLALSSLVIGLPAILEAGGMELSWWQVILVLAAGGVMLHPAILGVLRRLPGRVGRMFSSLHLPPFPRMMVIYLYYLLLWCLFGAVFVHFAGLWHELPDDGRLQAASGLAASFFFGFVMVFVPGGIGVRESVLVLLLAPHLTLPAAVFISLASRLWMIAGELLSVALVEVVYRYRGRVLTA